MTNIEFIGFVYYPIKLMYCIVYHNMSCINIHLRYMLKVMTSSNGIVSANIVLVVICHSTATNLYIPGGY